MSLLISSNHGDRTKYDSVVVRMGDNETVVVTFAVVLLFPFITKS